MELQSEARHDTGAADMIDQSDLHVRVILDVARLCPHKFAKNGHVLPAVTAFQSAELVRNLIKLGLFSMNMPNMREMVDGRGNLITGKSPVSAADIPLEDEVSFRKLPAFYVGMGVHYAIEAAPSSTEPAQDGSRIILLDELAGHIDRIEAAFGSISMDQELVERVNMTAGIALAEHDMEPESVE